ncbi:MAG TPA: cysteine-rich CWC family protein [Burkholderiaceae bacterium]|nr:cysteine-rich CWC family protein [Burkholderiaceae bacterium]
MTLHSPTINENNCAICGEPNQCAMATEHETGVKQGPCWCTTVKFSKSLLVHIPAEKQQKACICAACAALHQS